MSVGVLAQAETAGEAREGGRLLAVFARYDFDSNLLLSESELEAAMRGLREARPEVAAKREAQLGSPEEAAGYLVANFDGDGNWELDVAELESAFATVRRWARVERLEREEARI
jgi:hypothetical protein